MKVTLYQKEDIKKGYMLYHMREKRLSYIGQIMTNIILKPLKISKTMNLKQMMVLHVSLS